MAIIEPGDLFTISYGNEHELDVTALSLRQAKFLSRKVKELVAAEEDGRGLDLFELTEEALALAIGAEMAEELIDEVDAEIAMDISSKVLAKQALSEEEKKRPESLPSCSVESSAEYA
ncbi:MAG: hypothetical protein HKN35_15810 [Woeseia sp.]|nr:hypothetical protein [Woeseia sp.]